MARRKVTAQQVARWKGRELRAKREKKREQRLRRNHYDDCTVFAGEPCSCGGRAGSGDEGSLEAVPTW